VEALIDDLTEHREEHFFSPSYRSMPETEAYWKLVTLGFDAVPSLIEHVNDERYTRGIVTGSGLFYRMQVGHVCREILTELSGSELEGYDLRRVGRVDPEAARNWFAAAKKVGEEKWLLDHVLPTRDTAATRVYGRPEEHILRVLGAKYPKHLPAAYRAILKQRPPLNSEGAVQAIVASRLTREAKTELLLEGVRQTELGHHDVALRGLAEVDAALFRKHLLLSLKEEGQSPSGFIDLVERAGDPRSRRSEPAGTASIPGAVPRRPISRGGG
jgi:hypothetical protein